MTKCTDRSLSFWRVASCLATSLALAAAACSDGVTTAEVQQRAKERVRQELGLHADAALFTEVFVGRERDDEPVLCGTVGGRRADGATIAPRRFIVGMENSGFLRFEPLRSSTAVTHTDMFPSWAELCAGAEGETGTEPLAPTEIGEN